MCRAWIPATELNSSPKRCAVAAVPEEAKVYLPGFAFNSATNSFASAAGNEGCTTRAKGTAAIRLTGARSFSGSYGIRSEEHTSELQSHSDLVCRLLLEKNKKHRR